MAKLDPTADLEDDVMKAVAEAKARPAPLDTCELEARIRAGLNAELPRGLDEQRDAWEKWLNGKPA